LVEYIPLLMNRREMSFAIGRPDTLGADIHHNRRFPLIKCDITNSGEAPEMLERGLCSIIKASVDLSRITRTMSLSVYASEPPPQRIMLLANQLEKDLDAWVESLPPSIRPSRMFPTAATLKMVREAAYAKRQRLVLTISKPRTCGCSGRLLIVYRVP
jgi:hypothetical protein